MTRRSAHRAILATLLLSAASAAGEPARTGRETTWGLSQFSRSENGTVPLRSAAPAVLQRTVQDTLTAVELDPGEVLRLTLRNGQCRTLAVESTAAAILERVVPGGIVYHFTCRVRVDGHPLTMDRYACTQESFYEPYVVDGMRIWLDSVADVFQIIPIRYPRTGNLDAHPHKRVRLAVQDATLSICPQDMHPWLPRPLDRIDVGECYNGDDCWMGPYLGHACHVGLDINHRKGDPLWAPIDFDDQWYFHSLKAGQNNNRWRGLRRWPNGDLWALQTHHLIDALVPEHAPLRAGTKYATTAGTAVGSHPHTHFEFKVVQPRGEKPQPVDFDDDRDARQQVIHLDPWILFRQIFEDGKRRRGGFSAAVQPLSPGRTGQPVQFAALPITSPNGGRRCFWTFGDGGWATGPTVTHTFARPGIYPVTLVVEERRVGTAHQDATERRVGTAHQDATDCGGQSPPYQDSRFLTSQTQHMTVDGPPVAAPCLALAAPDEPAFRPRPAHAMDVYGAPVWPVPHTLEFTARPSRPTPAARIVQLKNLGGKQLPPASAPRVDYADGKGWLTIEPRGEGNAQSLRVGVDASGLEPGAYAATVHVDCAAAMNSPQGFRVRLHVPTDEPPPSVTVDDRDAGFYATPCFWVGHRFCNCKRKGHAGSYLTNGGLATEGEFVRFTPDLRAGRYRVALHAETPFPTDAEFDVRVRHKAGEQTLRVRPADSRVIGAFEFSEGTDGFVEVLAGGSKGPVVADAVKFKPE